MKRWYILVAILLVFPFKLIGQATVPGQGINPGRDYLQSPIDTIDTSSGALNLKIPIVSYKQRGSLPDFGLSLTYNNVVWVNVVTPYFGENVMDCGVTPCNALENYWIPNNLGISVQRDNALSWAAMVFPPQEANTTDELAIYAVADDTRATHLFYGQQGSGINGARTTDGSGLQIHVLSPLPGDHTVFTDSNGITHSGAFDQILPGSDDAWTDPDGNSVTPYMDGSSTLYWVDSVGRTIPAPATFEPTNGVPDTPPACFTTQFPAVNGGTAPYTFCYSSVPVNEIAVPVPNILYQYSGSPTMLSSLTLPDGTSYTFTYNSTGDLAQITLPQGGTIKYTWITAPTNVLNGTVFQRAVQTRTLNAGDNAPDQVWTFAYTVGGATITDPMGNDSVYAYSPPNGSSGSSVGYNTIVHYQGTKSGNNVLSTITKCLQLNGTDVYEFAYPYAIPSTLSCGVTTTLNDGSTSQVLTGYDPVQSLGDPLNQYDTYIASMNLGMPVSTTETDYGAGTPGPVLKTTNTEYEWQANSNYLSANLMALPHSTSVTDGSGRQIAQTTYGYDENNGSPQGTYGHNTSTQSWLNTTGGAVQTSTVYNSQGMPTQQIDANLNVTAITAYQCSGLLPQTVVSAYQSTTTMPETTSYVYDCNTSQATAITDPNSVTTQYVYDDPLGRITQVKTAVGTNAENWTAYTYPSATQINVVQDEVTKGDGLLHKSSVYDGLGQVIHYTAPNGATTDTGYDLAGRIQSVSNPHLPTVSSTNGTTLFAYDALGRKTLQTQQDGSTQRWSYNGNVVQFTDEGGNLSSRTSDVFGRLTKVVEPNMATTNYAYDALNNLTSVNQQGVSGEIPRTRSFNYDSLSRLHCASNPEDSQNSCPASAATTLPSGVTSYIYDANSNVTSKTDARGITTSYHYDGLNRLIQKTYNDGVTNTNLYGYDSSSVGFVPVPQNGRGNVSVSLANTIGRLAYASSTTGGTLAAFSYDAMGRLVNQWSTTPSFNNSNGPIAAISAGYDLAGNQTSLTYPDGRKISQSIDGAGRVSSVNYAAWNATAHTGAYLAVASPGGYDAAGHLVSATLGNGVGIGAGYDNRERISQLVYGSTSQMLWGKQYQWTKNSNLQNLTDGITGIQRQFNYDNLNRLTSAQDIVGTMSEPTPSPSSGASGGLDSSGGATPTPSWTDPDDSNVLINPETPGSNGWILGAATVAGNVAAPDGTMTAYTFTATSGSSDSYLQDLVADAYQYTGETMTGSVWLRSPNGTQTINLYLTEIGSSGYNVSASKPVTVTTAWQQFQLSGQFQNGYNNLVLQVGGGGSVTSGKTVSLWGSMVEDMGSTGVDITNYLPNSQRFTASTWLGNSITPSDNAATAPDGTNTASTLTASTGSTDSHIEDIVPNPAAFSGQPVTGSVWMRSVAGTQNILLTLFEVGAGDAPGGYSTIGSNAVALTSNWQRFQVSGTTLNALSQLLLQVGGAGTFTSGSIQVWGAQLELASMAGPYVATGATAVSAGTNLTNLLPYSQQPNGSSWSPNNASISLNSTTAPDGTSTAATVTAVAGSPDTFTADFVQNPALYNNQTLTASVYLRAASGTQNINLYLLNVGTGGWTAIATSTVTLTTSWQRFSVTGTTQNGLTSLYLQIGGGGSITSGHSYQVWGAQMQLGPTVGPYVATSALPVLAGQELTNILPNSQGMNGPAWSEANSSAAANTATAPDGTNTAATVTATASSPDTYIVANVPNPSLYDGETVTVSVYARVTSGTLNTPLYILNTGESGWAAAAYDPITLTTTWQRFSVTATLQNGLTQLYMQLGGNGTVTSGKSFQLWGAQLVVGSDPAPYTPTSSGTTNVATGQPATLAPNGLNEAYSYDSFGNIQQNGSFTASYTANNQLVNGQYDAAGNLLSNYLSPMTWDAENRLISVGGATYVYDANGNRVEKQGVGVTDTVYFGGRPVARLSAGQWTDLIYGPNGMLGEVAGTENADTAYRLLDHLGTEVGTVNSTGILTNPLDYTPFGQVFSGSTNDLYLFTGKERDSESGLDYFGARYYGSNMGRWMSPDYSMNSVILELPQSWNKYSYVLNRPLYASDPDGRCPWCVGAVVGGVVEGGFDLGKQLYNNGGSLSKVSWGEVGANALGGAVAGAVAVGTGGLSLIGSSVADGIIGNTVGNVVGGVVTRAADPNTPGADVLSAGEVAQDAVSGFVGGTAGTLAGEVVHVPDEPVRPDPRHQARTSVYNVRMQARNQAIVSQAIRGGTTGSAVAHGTNGAMGLVNSLWNWLMFSPPPSNPHPNEHVTVTLHFDPNQQPQQ